MVMAEIQPLFYPPLDGILPHSPMGYVAPKKNSGANNGCWIHTLWLFWLIIITGTKLPFGWTRQWLKEIPCVKLFTAAVYTRQDVSLGTLVFLPSLPGMVKAEFPATHIGWLVLPTQTLPNSLYSLMENCWAFLRWLLQSNSIDGDTVQLDSTYFVVIEYTKL